MVDQVHAKPADPAVNPAMPTNKVANVVAGIVAVVYLAMSFYLLDKYPEWERTVVVYNALSAIAFSAFGVLLGSKVQEVNVVKAVQTAKEATADAQKKGEAVKAAAMALGDDEAGGGTIDPRKANRVAHDILVNAMR